MVQQPKSLVPIDVALLHPMVVVKLQVAVVLWKQRSMMSSTKRALLIASLYGELRGPTNDVELLGSVLKQQISKITRCCGTQATCKNIRTQWRHLIRRLHTDDIAVIYTLVMEESFNRHKVHKIRARRSHRQSRGAANSSFQSTSINQGKETSVGYPISSCHSYCEPRLPRLPM